MDEVLRVFLAAMTPIGELRLSIPLGIWGLEIAWQRVLLLSVVGNMVPVIPLLVGLERISPLINRLPGPIGRLWAWRTERIRVKYGHRIDRYGVLALILIVGIPLPFTGAWTGSLAAWIFQIPTRRALPAIGLGVLLAGSIVTAIVLAGVEIGVILSG
jgi:uncharacterized membrane protein